MDQTLMGRPSKLTDRQKAEIRQRLASGEPQRALAKEFGVSIGTISGLFEGRSETIKSLAHAVASVENKVELLNISEQVIIRNMADQLKAMQADYTRGAALSLDTAAHLHSVANQRAKGINQHSETEDLKAVAALTQTANQASVMATNLLNANKPKDGAIVGDEPPIKRLIVGDL